MVKSCFKCGNNRIKDKDIILFDIPSETSNSEWQIEFIKCLGIEDAEKEDIQICHKHFNPEDLEVKNNELVLKENALPIEDDVKIEEHISEGLEEANSHYDGDESGSEADETKALAPLEPLVEYVYDESPDYEVQTDENIEVRYSNPKSDNVIIDHDEDMDRTHLISLVSQDTTNVQIEPILPFFLTSSPVFTILNENNEIGETIIVQIENTDEKNDSIPESDLMRKLQKYLCNSSNNSVSTDYSCEICDYSYGCLNCLKSHYETLHIYKAMTQYKCRYSYHISKSLICPVCELLFHTKSDAMDHYITHSVACDLCGSGFDRQSYLTEHYRTAHNRSDHEATFECELCKTIYQNASNLTRHYQTCHKMVLCYICKIRFSAIRELQEHEKIHRKKVNVLPFACSKCNKAFPKISDIAVHIRQDHRKEYEHFDGVGSKNVNSIRRPPKRLKVEK